MKELRRFFDYLKPHETVGDLRRSLLASTLVSFALFALVAPVAATVVCGALLALSVFINYFNLKIPAAAAYGLGTLLLFTLRASLPGGAYSQEFFASVFMVLVLSQSIRLTSYWHAQLLLIWLLASNSTVALLDDSATLSVWIFVVMFLNLGQMLSLHLKKFSLATLTNSLRSALRTSAYALPMLLVFIFVFQKSYSNRHAMGDNSVMGVSRRLEPGKVSKLSARSGTAYRVSLDRPLPPLVSNYWRVSTLLHSEGLSWRNRGEHETGYLQMTEGEVPARCRVRQKIYGQEFDTRNSALALDRPVRGTVTRDRFPAVLSSLCDDLGEGPLTAAEVKEETLVEGDVSPQVRALAQKLARGTSSPEQVGQNILSFYKTEKFKYALENNIQNLDGFLFLGKTGYCEHYAAATATLLRLAGVPARIVVGFQGGTYNPYGDYWLISYQDAHAWTEMWNGRGWKRLDAVATVAPAELHGARTTTSSLARLGRLPGVQAAWLALDDLLFKAQQLFSGHDKILALSDLTMDPFLALGSLLLLFLILQVKKYLQPVEAKLQEQFGNFCQFLAAQGLRRGRSEGYEAYRQRVAEWLGSDARLQSCIAPINELFFSYEMFRFGTARPSKGEIGNLIQLAKFCRKKLRKQFRFSFVLGFFN